MKTCPKFKCWKCERDFNNLVDLNGAPVLVLECPHCAAQCKVDFNSYRQKSIEVLRGSDGDIGLGDIHLPSVIKTTET